VATEVKIQTFPCGCQFFNGYVSSDIADKVPLTKCQEWQTRFEEAKQKKMFRSFEKWSDRHIASKQSVKETVTVDT
jgi:hypothetical protein